MRNGSEAMVRSTIVFAVVLLNLRGQHGALRARGHRLAFQSLRERGCLWGLRVNYVRSVRFSAIQVSPL